MKDLHSHIAEMGDRAVVAADELASLGPRKKKTILRAMADEIEATTPELKKANAKDMKSARDIGMSPALLDRLELTDARIQGMAKGLRDIAMLKDPIGRQISRWIRPNGLTILKVRVPIGVIGIIYESRPNVTADATGLCIKASNAVILRGGKESLTSNKAITDALQTGGAKCGLPDNSVQLITTLDRKAVRELVQLEGKVDLIIPRGGEGLIRAVTHDARIPVIKHYKGVCHTYVDATANLDMALQIVENAKCQRPGVCNAMETLLVHETIAPAFLPRVVEKLGHEGVKFRGDTASRKIIASINEATEEDWYAEYLDMILAVKIVASVDEAVDHVNSYGSHHSDAIVAEDDATQQAFLKKVNSAAVYVNASTRFTDGGEFGMGAEIGISTDKLHARGPMGLEELTTYKYQILGSGQVR